MSPDGRRLAYLAPDEGVMNVWVGSLDGDAFKPVTADRDRGVRFFAWARDNRHLLYIQDRGGDENWHLYRVDPTSSRTLDLTPFEGVQARSEGMSKHVPGVVLVGLNRRTTERHDLYRLDLSSGDLTLLEENPGYLGWTADLRLRPRAALRMGDDESSQILVRDQDRDGFRVIYEVGPEDGMGLRPLGFEAGGRHLFLLSSKDANARRLLRMEASSGKVEVVFEDPEADMVGVLRHWAATMPTRRGWSGFVTTTGPSAISRTTAPHTGAAFCSATGLSWRGAGWLPWSRSRSEAVTVS